MSLAMQTLAVTRPEAAGGIGRDSGAHAVRARPEMSDCDGRSAAVRGIARAGDVVAISETCGRDRARRIRPAGIRSSVATRLRAFAASRRARHHEPTGIDATGDRSRPAWRKGAVGALRCTSSAAFSGAAACFTKSWVKRWRPSTGTRVRMPPYERAIVFSPREPDAFAQSFFDARSASRCAVVDANDLARRKCSERLAACCANVAAALLDNPHGNSDEQTPVVVLKWRGVGANPLLGAPT